MFQNGIQEFISWKCAERKQKQWLNSSKNKTSQAAGAQPGAEQQQPSGESQPSGDGNVTDVPYEEVKDEKK